MTRLESDPSDGLTPLLPLVLDDPMSGIYRTAIDFGATNPRQVSTPRPLRHGTTNRTKVLGDRSVTMTLELFDADTSDVTVRDWLDRLAPWCDPERRSFLYFTDPAGAHDPARRGERRIRLVADKMSAPREHPTSVMVAASWIGYRGVLEDAAETTATVVPADDAPGWSPPLVPPLTFPGPLPAIGTTVHQIGTTAAEITARIHGPITGPVLTNVTTGELVSFPGLVLRAGEWLDLDFAAPSALQDGTANRYGRLDFALSTWWRLPMGQSVITLTGESITPDARAELAWRSPYLL